MNQAAKELIARSHFGTGAFSLNGCNVPLQQLAASMCSHPIKTFGRNQYYNSNVTYYAPCGRCKNCRNTMGNELSARFYHDATLLKHAYFITLTYPSFEHEKNIPETLKYAFYHYDNFNSNAKKLWSPCILYYPHVQSFNKLLRTRVTRSRKSVPYFEIITTGELGHRFGRPHWHMLIISDVELFKEDIVKSWIDTIKVENSRVDFVDIVSNGTLEARPESPYRLTNASRKNIKHCVKYLVKYTRKSELKYVNTVRLSYAYEYFTCPSDDDYVLKFGRKNLNNICFIKTPYYEKKVETLFKIPRKQEKPRFQTTADVYLRFFYSLFGSRHQLSTTNAIGKIYALSNCERFATGNRSTKPVPSFTATMVGNNPSNLLKNKQSSIFPKYYYQITERYKFPFCNCKKATKGSIQYSKINMYDLHSYMHLLDTIPYFADFYTSPSQVEHYHVEISQPADLDFLGIELEQREIQLLFPSLLSHNKTSLNNSPLFKPSYVYDTHSHSRYCLCTVFDNTTDWVIPRGFCFCRQKYIHRKWSKLELVDFSDILHEYVELPLLRYKSEYLNRLDDNNLFTTFYSLIADSDEFLIALKDNESNWQRFKTSKNKQTLKLNPYD